MNKIICKQCNKEHLHNRKREVLFCCQKCYFTWKKENKVGFENYDAKKERLNQRKDSLWSKYKQHQCLICSKIVSRGNDKCRSCACSKTAKRGENSNFWKGGISTERQKIYASIEYKNWRKSVFERDGYMCVIGKKEHGDRLQADHIKPFSLFPELRFELSNGRTLCIDCHKKTDTYGGRIIKLKTKSIL